MQTKPIRRKRGGMSATAKAERERQKDIHSKIDGMPNGTFANHAHNLHGTSATAAVANDAIYCECAIVEETRETHCIPRESLSRKQFLRVLPPELELEEMHAKQLDKRSGQMVETTDNRLKWKRDRSLLKQGNPFAAPKSFRREGSVSAGLNTRKFIKSVPEPEDDSKVLGPEVDVFFRD